MALCRVARLGPVLALCLSATVLAHVPAAVAAQWAEVRVEENFRAEPNGTVLGQLAPGTRLEVEGRDGGWTQVTLEGFVWTRSMQIQREEGFDLVISEREGENVRDEPEGRVVGRLVRGTRLTELDRVPGWVRVRRTGWIWSESVELAGDAEPAAEVDEEPGGGWMVAPAGGALLLTSPDGDTIARAVGGSEMEVLSREGTWTRVRVEGWVWSPSEAEEEGEPAAPLTGVTPADLAEDPERYRGRRVIMELQFLSLERAEAVRTDFYEGEPFLLTRSLDGDRRFVYVAVPPDRTDEVDALSPLDRLRITGRVRTGAATYTANPILELLNLERLR